MSPRDGVRGSFLIPGDGVKGSFLLFRYNEISVDGSLDEAVLVDFFLHLKELVEALLHREIRELPFYDASKPHECSHVIESDWSVHFFASDYFKSGFFKFLFLDREL